MDHLETFILSGCSKVRQLPEFGKDMKHLSRLDLEETAIVKLPQSLANLIGLTVLNLRNCKNLVCLPNAVHKLKAMKFIDISSCLKFSRLQKNLNENEASEELDISGTAIKEVPSSSWNHFSHLRRAFRLQRPSNSIKFMLSLALSNLSSLNKLYLSYCDLQDGSLPNDISSLSSLTYLDLSGNNFVDVPSGLISSLPKLECIVFNDCPKLQSLPLLPSYLSIVLANDCPSMEHYVCSQQLWEFFESFQSQVQLQSEVSFHHVVQQYKWVVLSNLSTIMTWDSQIPDFFMQPTRKLVVSGSEVPSWFDNQKYFGDEKVPYNGLETNVQFMINIPDYCRSSEWWGIAVCLVLENNLASGYLDQIDGFWWCYKFPEDVRPKTYCFCPLDMPLNCGHVLCIMYIRCSSFFVNQLRMLFGTMTIKGKKSAFEIRKCGWRVLCKKDVETWRKARDEGCSCSNIDIEIDSDNYSLLNEVDTNRGYNHNPRHRDQFIVEEDEFISDVEPSSL